MDGVIIITVFLLQYFLFFVQFQRICMPLEFGLAYIVCQLQVCILLFQQVFLKKITSSLLIVGIGNKTFLPPQIGVVSAKNMFSAFFPNSVEM